MSRLSNELRPRFLAQGGLITRIPAVPIAVAYQEDIFLLHQG